MEALLHTCGLPDKRRRFRAMINSSELHNANPFFLWPVEIVETSGQTGESDGEPRLISTRMLRSNGASLYAMVIFVASTRETRTFTRECTSLVHACV